MPAVLKNLSLYGYNMERLLPEDVHCFGGLLEAEIGMESMEGGDRFSAVICTPSWFAGHVLTSKKQHPTSDTFYQAAFGNDHLFVIEFDEGLIREIVERLIREHGQGEWSKAAMRLSNYMTWEHDFEKIGWR